MPSTRRIYLSTSLWLVVFLSACESLPQRGNIFVAEIKSFPARRQDLQTYPELALAIQRGITRQDVTSGNLVKSGCYIDNGMNALVVRRFGFIMLPEGVKVETGDILEVVAEEVDGTGGPFARFLGRFTKKTTPNASDYFSNKILGNAFRCGTISPSGTMLVAVISKTHYWDFDFAKAEESRNSHIRDEELLKRKIAIGVCSPGVDSWAIWKVRLPDHLDVKVGEYIEAVAGSYEGSTSEGPISEALRKIGRPQKTDFIRTQGADTVSCSAQVDPSF